VKFALLQIFNVKQMIHLHTDNVLRVGYVQKDNLKNGPRDSKLNALNFHPSKILPIHLIECRNIKINAKMIAE
jgi:hypothetical protein